MNTQLVKSIAQMINSLSQEEQILLNELYFAHSERANFNETTTTAEWIEELKQWAKSRSQNTVNLSDEAISRESIYGERG